MLRGARLEAGFFSAALNEALDPDNCPVQPMNPDMICASEIEITRTQNRNFCVAEGVHRIARESNSWSLLLRYQAKAEREYRRAIEDFERLKALRSEMPNEPNVGAETPEPEDIAPMSELNSLLDPRDLASRNLASRNLASRNLASRDLASPVSGIQPNSCDPGGPAHSDPQ